MSWQNVPDWRSRPGVHAQRPDPYLIWAELTGWRDLLKPGAKAHAVSLLVELTGARIARLRRALAALVPDDHHLPAAYAKGRFVALWLTREKLSILADSHGPVGALVERFDLCMPLPDARGRRPVKARPLKGRDQQSGPPSLRGEILMGLIDTGCPFAHEQLLRWNGTTPSTRIAALWDMRHRAVFGSARPRDVGAPPASMGYGWQALRDYARGIDAWLRRFTRADGRVEENEAYLHAGYGELRARATHGAHVLNLLAGPVPLRSRIPVDADEPPSWDEADNDDAAADATRSDLAFVQLPSSALQDSSGGWLGAHVLDGVNYLVNCSGGSTKDVVVNLSYGCTVGPHDGSSILEAALDAIVARGGTGGRPRVHLVMAAGNSFAQRGHALLTRAAFATGYDSRPLVWRILPHSETPSFLQMWLPRGLSGKGIRLRLQAPGESDVVEIGVDEVKLWRKHGQPLATAVYLGANSRGDGSAMLLLAVAPTERLGGRASAPHGDWILSVHLDKPSRLPSHGEIHAYIARNDRDFGTLLRGRQSYFADDADEPSRHLRGCADDPEKRAGEIDTPAEREGAVIRRRGTLNGIATGKQPWVAAGYQRRLDVHAPYSSAGSTGSERGRGPDAAHVTDEAAVLRGVRAAGSLSGAAVRLVGTSTAAPQAARKKVRELATPPGPPPPPPKPPTQPVPDPELPEDAEDLWGPSGKQPAFRIP